MNSSKTTFISKRFGLLFIALTGLLLQGQAQDIHFSQTEIAPLQLNVALSGIQGKFNTNLVARTQWNAVPSSFKTLYVAADGRFNPRKTNVITGGIDVFRTESGGSTRNESGANFSLGSIIRLSQYTALSTSISAGMRQLSLNTLTGQWASQYNGIHYDASLESGENFARQQLTVMTLSAGMVFQYSNQHLNGIVLPKREWIFGIAGYNLNQPKTSFLTYGSSRLPARYTAFTQLSVPLHKKNRSLQPAVFVQYQQKYLEIIAGTSLKTQLGKSSGYSSSSSGNISLSAGLFYRVNDAFILRALVEWSSLSAGISYDINCSKLISSSHYRGATEITLRYLIR